MNGDGSRFTMTIKKEVRVTDDIVKATVDSLLDFCQKLEEGRVEMQGFTIDQNGVQKYLEKLSLTMTITYTESI